jgi:hypothetical protein
VAQVNPSELCDDARDAMATSTTNPLLDDRDVELILDEVLDPDWL